MIITSIGDGGFKVQASSTVILIESEKSSASGKLKADVFIRTKTDGEVKADFEHLVKGPGEYEFKGVEVKGYPPYIYTIKTGEDITLGYFGSVAIKNPEFNPTITEKLMDLDIMFIGSSEVSAKAIRQFHPKVIITDTKPEELEKELGLKAEKLDKLVIKSKDIDRSGMKLILLK